MSRTVNGPFGKPHDDGQGWELACTSGGDHLKRIVGMYREMGFEVRVEAVQPAECNGCTQCFRENDGPFFRVYKRRSGTVSDGPV